MYFLGASALFRDGLAAVFTFGAVLAVTVYGINSADVLIFGVAANVVSAIGALTAGRFDDRCGPEADHRGLAERHAHRRHDPAVRLRADRVLDLRTVPVPVRRPGAVLVPDVPGQARAARPARVSCSVCTRPPAAPCRSWRRRCSACSPTCSAADRAGIVGILLVLAGGLLALLPVQAAGAGRGAGRLARSDCSRLESPAQPALPAPGARFALERPHDVGGDPAAVEPAGLRQHPLAVDVALDHGRHERQEPGDRHEPRGRRS